MFETAITDPSKLVFRSVTMADCIYQTKRVHCNTLFEEQHFLFPCLPLLRPPSLAPSLPPEGFLGET